jgi:hypothetical protein
MCGCKGMLLYTYLDFYRLCILHVNLSYTKVRHWIVLTFDRTRIPTWNYSDYKTVKSMPFIFLRTIVLVPPVYLTFVLQSPWNCSHPRLCPYFC